MKKGHPHIWLYQPEIPQNTGTIARLCAATACRLHILAPTKFSLADKNLKRAGLDYWPFLDWEYHIGGLEEFRHLSGGNFAILSTHGKNCYTEIPLATEHFLFGTESKGLPPEFRDSQLEKCYRFPMVHPGVRSLNLANSVSVIVYHRLSLL
jgi:tRNA (cytidine/uridine-2'-O-)-methyltransferase